MLSHLNSSIKERKISSVLTVKLQELEFSNQFESYSQLGQDKLAYIIDSYKETKYFVEFGATDGLTLSNTAALELNHHWKGLLAEPGRRWFRELKVNRSSIVDTRCVWKLSGDQILFYEQGELSGISELVTQKSSGEEYFVRTVSLEDLLKENATPRQIGFLSIDTEGSEYEILKAFNFQKYDIAFIACEHNYRFSRIKILRLLRKNGFHRILVDKSEWDDWYVHESVSKKII